MGAIGNVAEPLTNAQLRAAPVAISGTVTADLSGSLSVDNFPGSFAVSNFPASQPVTGAFFQATQPISGTVNINGTIPVSGTFWQATQPVSGSFFQATQPVSIAATVAISAAALPLPSGAASETTLAALNAKHPSQGQAVMASSVPVAIASNQSAIPVTGTFWQATQPISGAVSVSNFPASQAVTGTFWQATQPVSGTVGVSGSVAVTGTFFQATQPVSIAATVAVSGPLTDAQLRASAVPASLAALPALAAGGAAIGTVAINAAIPAGANSIGTTPGPALTKGTQGTVGHSTQDLKDAGRVIVNAATAIAGVTAVTTEALLSFNISRDCAATSAATSMAVTGGKRWRVAGIVVGIVTTSAAVLSARFSLRMNPTGAVTATSPIIATIPLSSGAALVQAGNELMVVLPDGIEFSGTMQIGISQVASAATGVVRVSLIGYEY